MNGVKYRFNRLLLNFHQLSDICRDIYHIPYFGHFLVKHKSLSFIDCYQLTRNEICMHFIVCKSVLV